jgi:serine-threonine kinase receptor-associated protein
MANTILLVLAKVSVPPISSLQRLTFADNYPMLRDGITGDWIGTFMGHKGAVWGARLSTDGTLAATGSADYTCKIWDTHTGACLHTLSGDNHIVRSAAFPPTNGNRPTIVATGGHKKRLNIYNLEHATGDPPYSAGSPPQNGVASDGQESAPAFEIAPGTHGETIKSVVWTEDHNILVTACDDRHVRWFDMRSASPISSFLLDGPVGSCELNTLADTLPTLSIAAGKSVYFFSNPSRLPVPSAPTKKVTLPFETASVGLNLLDKKFVVGSASDTWVRVWDYDKEEEVEVGKGHHGPVWSCSYSPDGKLYATGSEDGTIKLWKATAGPYGLWR